VQFWIFAGFALLYGVCETMNGNWSRLDLTMHLGLPETVAALALTAFWAVVTAGRVLFAVFLIIATLPQNAPIVSVLAFALAGLGCSALLPLTIGFGQEKLLAMSGAVAGGVIAFYQLGYGIAAFGVGAVQNAGVALPAIFAASSIVAVAMRGLSFVVDYRRPSPASLHPRPASPGAAAPT
jgi:hypothetical protein